jgi:hypothetical protein
MNFMLLIYGDEGGWDTMTEANRQQIIEKTRAQTEQLKSSGRHIVSAPLPPTARATSVRLRDGKRLVTDGPFAETKEQLGGFYLIRAENLDEAIAIAADHLAARRGSGTVEIRPVLELAGPPMER